MSNLNELMIKWGTDKSSVYNGYSHIYEKYFSQKKLESLKILEIGIFRPPNYWSDHGVAASLKTWKEYFEKSHIIGADIDDFSDVNEDRISTIIVNQENREELKKIVDSYGDQFDIIIDDGGHTMLQQQVTLGYLFKHLRPGGIFVMEDLITSYIQQEYYNSSNTQNTTLKILQLMESGENFVSEFMSNSEIEYLNNNIKKVIIEKGNKGEIAFIFKK